MNFTWSRTSIWLAVGLLVLAFVAAPAQALSQAAKRPKGKVWIVYFSSKECQFCKGVSRLIRGLAKRYPISVKKFDIGKPQHAALLGRIEAIHASGQLSVPVVLLDETILTGEEEIAAKLEPTVRRIAAAGGSALPYLGAPNEKDRPLAETSPRDCPTCERRPPTISEEWAKIRSLIKHLF